MTGSAIATAAQKLIMNVVMNGSATANVVGFRPGSSGLFSQPRIVSLNANVTTNAAPTATRHQTSLARSSPRCSTSGASSPGASRRGTTRRMVYVLSVFGACAGSSADCGSSTSSVAEALTELLNSRMPLPIERPISGSFFGPKTSSATMSRMMISPGPTQPGTSLGYHHPVVDPRPLSGSKKWRCSTSTKRRDLTSRAR